MTLGRTGMTSVLLSGSVWGRIRRLSRSSASTLAAAPYFGAGATGLLTFRAGNAIVLKFDREAIGSGQVDPREVVKAIRQGVQVHHCSNLHAKVFVFDKTAVVGSSNVSHNSERQLLEACVETTDRKVVEAARRFIRGLLGDRIGLDFAQKMIPYYRPPKWPRKGAPRSRTTRRTPTQSDMWWVSLAEGSWDDADLEQEEKGLPIARKAIKNPGAFEVKDFRWSGSPLFGVGQRIIECTKTENRKVVVSPPSRVVSIRRYSSKGRKRAIIYLEKPRKQRQRKLAAVLKNLGSTAARLGAPRRTKQIRDPELVYEIGRLWA